MTLDLMHIFIIVNKLETECLRWFNTNGFKKVDRVHRFSKLLLFLR